MHHTVESAPLQVGILRQQVHPWSTASISQMFTVLDLLSFTSWLCFSCQLLAKRIDALVKCSIPVSSIDGFSVVQSGHSSSTEITCSMYATCCCLNFIFSGLSLRLLSRNKNCCCCLFLPVHNVVSNLISCHAEACSHGGTCCILWSDPQAYVGPWMVYRSGAQTF